MRMRDAAAHQPPTRTPCGPSTSSPFLPAPARGRVVDVAATATRTAGGSGGVGVRERCHLTSFSNFFLAPVLSRLGLWPHAAPPVSRPCHALYASFCRRSSTPQSFVSLLFCRIPVPGSPTAGLRPRFGRDGRRVVSWLNSKPLNFKVKELDLEGMKWGCAQ